MEKKTVCVDFDGVLSDYKGWQGAEHLDSPKKGAVDGIVEQIERGLEARNGL